MSELGVPINAWQLRGVNSVTVKVNTTFRVPLRLADAFYATSAVRSVSRSQVVLAEAVRRRSDDAVVAVRVFCLFVVVVVGGGRFSCFSSAEGEIGAEKKKTHAFSSPPLFFLFFRKKNNKKTVLRGDLRDRRQRLQGGENPGGGPARPGEGRGEVCGRERAEVDTNFVFLFVFSFVFLFPCLSFVPFFFFGPPPITIIIIITYHRSLGKRSQRHHIDLSIALYSFQKNFNLQEATAQQVFFFPVSFFFQILTQQNILVDSKKKKLRFSPSRLVDEGERAQGLLDGAAAAAADASFVFVVVVGIGGSGRFRQLSLALLFLLLLLLFFSSSVSVLAFSASTTRFLQGERRRPRDPGEQRRQGIVFDVSFSLRSFGGDVGERGRLVVLTGGQGWGGQRRRAAAAGAGRRPQRRHVRARR